MCSQDWETVGVLIGLGANPSLAFELEGTILRSLAMEVVLRFCTAGTGGEAALGKANNARNREGVRNLVRQGLDLNLVFKGESECPRSAALGVTLRCHFVRTGGWTALELATLERDWDLVGILVGLKANVTATFRGVSTPTNLSDFR